MAPTVADRRAPGSSGPAARSRRVPTAAEGRHGTGRAPDGARRVDQDDGRGRVQPSRRRPRRSAADALHTQRDHASFLIDRGADYLLVVKANQPALHVQLAGLPWRKIPVMDRTRDHSHGRVEVRTLKVAAVAGLCFPHAAQGIQPTRRVRASGSRRWRTVTVYATTSLALGTASPAGWRAGCAGTGGSRTEHWVRDVTFSEDASHACTGSLPRVMASLRNIAIGALRLAGHPNLAAALRHTGRDPARPLTILGLAHA